MFCVVRSWLIGCTAAFFVISGLFGRAVAEDTIVIGTGGPTGVYYVVGQSICKILNAGKTAASKFKCEVQSTGGSIDNIFHINENQMDFGLVQSDWQHHAYNGTSQFEERRLETLRSVFSVHSEPFQIVVGKNSGIREWNDLQNRHINIGNPGSGQRGTFEELMIAHNIDASFFSDVSELSSSEQSSALCNGEVDAFGYSVGYPNEGVSKAVDGCGGQIISLQGKEIDGLIDKNPYYISARIPKGTYSTVDSDIKTFGVIATVMTNKSQSDAAVYTFVKAVFENLDQLKKEHPALANLEPEEMISRGLSAPLHPGAEKYYRERGWLK